MFYYIKQPQTLSVSTGLVKTEFDFTVTSVETGLGPVGFGLLRPDWSPWGYRMFSGCIVSPDSKETKLGSSNQETSPWTGKNIGMVLVPCFCMKVDPYIDELPIVFSTKVNLLYLLYSTALRCYLLHLIKQNCLLNTFLRTLILITQASLYLFSPLELMQSCIFSSRTNPKLHNISVTPKMVKKIITNFDLLKASGPDCIPVVDLKIL